MNNNLHTKLSQSVTTWTSQTEALTEAAKSKLMSSDIRLKKAQKEVSKLCKGFRQAIQIKEHAVETAKAKIISQKSVHHLMHKGVFTRKLAILFVFFPNLAVQQSTSMKLFLLYSTQQALPWLEASAAHLLLK